MKKIFLITISIIFFLCGCSQFKQYQQKRSDEKKSAQDKEIAELSKIKLKEYVFGPGDEFDITVARHDDLTKTVVVNPNGEVAFPYIGTFKADGLTYAQLHSEFEKRLAEYYKEPKVSINVKKTGSRKVYVLGYVKAPGVYPIDNTTKIASVIASASGFTSEAEKKSVLYIEGGTEKKTAVRVNFNEITNGDLRYNIPINSGDIVYVPRSFIADVDAFMMHSQNILNTVVALERSVILFYDAKDAVSGSGGNSNVNAINP